MYAPVLEEARRRDEEVRADRHGGEDGEAAVAVGEKPALGDRQAPGEFASARIEVEVSFADDAPLRSRSVAAASRPRSCSPGPTASFGSPAFPAALPSYPSSAERSFPPCPALQLLPLQHQPGGQNHPGSSQGDRCRAEEAITSHTRQGGIDVATLLKEGD